METQQRTGRENALKHELVGRTTRTTTAAPEVVYDLLSDLESHLTWGGDQQSDSYRLREIEAPAGPAVVGTEFTTVGADPMGEFRDRSVVTEADRASVFGFVTEARFTTTKGAIADWTLIHRYEIASAGGGSTVTYTVRTTRISALPSMLKLFSVPVLRGLLMRYAMKGPDRGLANLCAMAEQRARGDRP